jgi:hypothetical protein
LRYLFLNESAERGTKAQTCSARRRTSVAIAAVAIVQASPIAIMAAFVGDRRTAVNNHPKVTHIYHLKLLSLLKIPFEPEFEQLRESLSS